MKNFKRLSTVLILGIFITGIMNAQEVKNEDGFKLILSETHLDLQAHDTVSITLNVEKSRKLRNSNVEIFLEKAPEGLWHKLIPVNEKEIHIRFYVDDHAENGNYSILIKGRTSHYTKSIVLNAKIDNTHERNK